MKTEDKLRLKANKFKAWTKGNKVYPSVFGYKNDLAGFLIGMKLVDMNNRDAKKLGLKNNSLGELLKIPEKEASNYLLSKGWKWEWVNASRFFKD